MKTVAIVEDNPDNRLLVNVLLSDRYELQEFENGEDALNAFKTSPPDLILLDISLPGLDGVDVLNRLRSDSQLKNIPVIALTAHAMAGDRKKYLDLGFDAYLTKPILDETLLYKAIDTLLKA